MLGNAVAKMRILYNPNENRSVFIVAKPTADSASYVKTFDTATKGLAIIDSIISKG
jgi:hypothetical protein